MAAWPCTTPAATVTWDANGTAASVTDGAGAWLGASQWWNGTSNVSWTSGDDAVFGVGGTGGAVTLSATTTAASLAFNSFSGTYTLGTSGQTLTLGSGGLMMNAGAGAVTLASPITLGTAQSWTNNSASLLTASAAITNGGFGLTFAGSGSTTLSGTISGAGGLTKSGAGTLTLGNVQNTYSGGTIVNGGTLTLGTGAANGNIRGSLTVNSGAAVNANAGGWSLGYGGTRSGAAYSGTSVTSITINSGLLNFTNVNSSAGLAANTITLTGGTVGGVSFAWYNANTLTPTLQTLASSARSTLSGGISLRLSTSGTLTFDVASGSTADGIDLLVSGPITDAVATDTQGSSNNGGNLVKAGAGRMVLSGSNTFPGGLTLSAGQLDLNSTTAAGAGGFTITGGTIGNSSGSAITLSNNNAQSWSADFTFAGPNDLNLGSGAVTLGASRSVTVSAGTLTVGGPIAGVGFGLTKAGSGVLALTGTSTFTGGITISSGTLQVGGAGALGTGTYSSAISVASGAGLAIATSTGQTLSGTISGSGGLTKSGAGALTLSGSNGYTGTTSITGGRLVIASNGRINSTSGITINGSDAELKYNSATPLTQPITFTQGTISGTGTIGTAVTVGTGDILSPGNSPGIQAYTRGLTWDPAGTYLWEVNDATSTAGTGWDLINVSGGSGLVINATSGTTFKIAITSLSGTAAGSAANFSATKAGSWTILSSSNGITGFAANKFTLDRSAFSNTSSGSFMISQVGSGSNQSLVLAYNTISSLTSSTSSVTGFRVMQNQGTTMSVNLTNSGPDATDYSLSPSAALSLIGSSTGTLAGSGTQAISVGYASTAATGARSGTVSFTNTGIANNAAGTFTVAGAVVDNRVVTASAVNFGLVHLGASGTVTSTFTSAGLDDNFTRIRVANGSGGGLIVSGSSGFVFDGSGGSSRAVAGSFGTAGAISGTITLTNSSAETGGPLPGQLPGTTNLPYSVSVFSGTGTWTMAGGGSWGTSASSNWTSTGGVGAAPGTFADYTNTDRAIFAGSQTGTSTILLNGATPSLAALVISNTANRYVLDQGSGGSLTLAASSGKPTIEVEAGGLHEIKAGILGSSGLEKLGVGSLVLSGSNGYTGATDVTAGTLAVNGSLTSASAVTVASNATLGGSGSIAGAITGAGLVSPGNSPGILTAGQFNSSAGLDAAFEFTGLAPTYTSASASVNDVLRLTNGSAPFATGTFTAGNVIDVYFNVDSIANGQIYEGGFFTGLSAVDLLATLDGKGSFSYWAKTTGAGTRSFGGVNYVDITTITGITGVTLQTSYGTKDFGGSVGSVTGSVTQFVIVPEPGAVALASIGIAAAAWSLRRQLLRASR
ncbi:MAG: autotransporter-associated beta strand repeat-containing protein [Planctomycetia bacterium]|nr:autotransporter-associated beta strand repeat-containing protein [Planctomycetia bacterium]